MQRTTSPVTFTFALLVVVGPGCSQDAVDSPDYSPTWEPETSVPTTTGSANTSATGGAQPSTTGAVTASTASSGLAGSTGTNPPGGTSTDATTVPTADGGMPAASGACDLTGRWLATLHYVTDAIGQKQTIHRWVYYEIEPDADGFAVKKGLLCGDEGVADGLLPVMADFSKSWDASTSRVSYAGRKLSSVPSAGGCDVHFERWYTVRGATLPHYLDTANKLPTADQQASGSTPGWEDWDEDGNPGVTGYISGTANGKIFVAPRQWTEMTGTVADTSSTMRMPLEWQQEPNVMSYDGSPVLGSVAAKAADPNLHFVQMARLQDDQAASGDDLTTCKEVRDLAPALTPEASEI